LALNFATADGKKDSRSLKKSRKKAFQRSLDLVSFLGEDADISYMERGVEYMNFLHGNRETAAANGLAKKLSKFAENRALTTSTFYGEVLTLQAGYKASKGRNKEAEEIANKALNAFANKTDNFQTAQPILANLYQGYSLEGQNKSMEAALSYQKVMEALDGIQPDEHPLAAKALGRWTQMRTVLSYEGRLEEAEQKGLCKCWPYDKPRNESIKPIKRVPPIMPREAWVSGFSIVKFNLDDAGSPIDEEILVSWPKGLYEKSSLRSLRKWEYSPRTSEETDADRQDIISTISYRLTDQFGDVIY